METAKIRSTIKDLAITVVLNFLIALFLTSMDFGAGLWKNALFSQCIGLSIFASVSGGYSFFRNRAPLPQLVGIFLALCVGAIGGMSLAYLLAGRDLEIMTRMRGPFFLKTLFVSLLFGTAVTYFFISRKELAKANTLIQEEKIDRLAREKHALEMHVRLLQAQIEPHFLFNTLSTIYSFMGTDAGKAETMLMNLTEYLRFSLAKSRAERITVAEEIEMITSYLNIFKVRMGERLSYAIRVDDSARALAIPPMLIQPLVENSIRHGLEPEVEGGRILVAIRPHGDMLHIEVADTGAGIKGHETRGIGLANVTERIALLFDEKGEILVEENSPRGLRVVIRIPLDRCFPEGVPPLGTKRRGRLHE